MFERIQKWFVWDNLPIQAKTGLIFAGQFGLILLMAGVGIAALNSAGEQITTGLSAGIEIQLLTQDLRVQTETLQRLHNATLTNFALPGFDPTTSSLPTDYGNIIRQMKEDVTRIATLTQELSFINSTAVIALPMADLSHNLDEVEANYQASFEVVTLLARPDSGDLKKLEQAGATFVEHAISLQDVAIINQANLIRGFEQDLIQSKSEADYTTLVAAIDQYETLLQNTLPEDTINSELIWVTAYRNEIENTHTHLARLRILNASATSSFTLLRTSADRVSSLITAQLGNPIDTMDTILTRARATLLVTVGVALLAGAFITTFFGTNIASRLQGLLDAARKLEAGNLRTRATAHGQDEFSQLARTFNSMATQLESLISGLEQRVAERTRDLSITAEIGHAVVAFHNPRELMNEVVELIRERFGFYHAQVFLIDDAAEYAVLTASTGMAGRELLTRNHRLEVGSQSVIGQVTSRGEAVIATDTDTSQVHRRNELLPDTRSEMALPMRMGNRIIGSLDVQSVDPDAFNQDSVAVFQIMADQLAIALENARLYTRLEQSQMALEAFERRVTRDQWRSYEEGRDSEKTHGFVYSEEKVEPLQVDAPTLLGSAIQQGALVMAENGETTINLAIPIKVRGEVIGAFGFGGEDIQTLSDEDIALIEAVVDRVGLALENLRLVEQTARRAEHEQIVNEITAKIVGSTDVNFILQTTVKELGRVLRAPQTSVQLRGESLESGNE
jgi:GAF domain-containing protein/HAMP domain-containing protein